MEKEPTKRTVGIDIDDKYALCVMPIDYALAKRQTDKDGKVTYKPVAFFGTVQAALRDYVKQAIHDTLDVESSISLDEAIKLIETAIERSNTAILKAFPEYSVIKRGETTHDQNL